MSGTNQNKKFIEKAPSTSLLVVVWCFFALSCLTYFFSPAQMLDSFYRVMGEPVLSPQSSEVLAKPVEKKQNIVIEVDSLDQHSDGLKDQLSRYPHFDEYSFDLLTPLGAEIFEHAREFLSLQQKDEFQSYAQPFMCASNLSYVLRMAGFSFHTAGAYYSVPYLMDELKAEGGAVYNLPRHTGENKQEIVDYLNTHFPDGIPTGAVIAGCTVRGCHTEGASDAHIALVGDKNHKGEVMIYHNNWLRPSVVRGQRHPYMPSLKNFYDRFRPRQWQATPWIRADKDSSGQITDFTTILPELDDLDPLNSKFYTHIIIPPEMVDELQRKDLLEHHKELVSRNVHKDNLLEDPESTRLICRSSESMRTLNARVSPGGIRNIDFYSKLSSVTGAETFFHNPFEFEILQREETDYYVWYSIRVFDAKRYWGEGHEGGAIWIKGEDHIKCHSKARWLNLYVEGEKREEEGAS